MKRDYWGGATEVGGYLIIGNDSGTLRALIKMVNRRQPIRLADKFVQLLSQTVIIYTLLLKTADSIVLFLIPQPKHFLIIELYNLQLAEHQLRQFMQEKFM